MSVGYVSGSQHKLKVDGAESFANKILHPVRIAFGRRFRVEPSDNLRNWAAPTFHVKKESSLKIASSFALCILLFPAMPLMFGIGKLANALSSTYKMRQHARHGRAYLPTMIFKTIPQKPRAVEQTIASTQQPLVQHLQQMLQPLPHANQANVRRAPIQPVRPIIGFAARPNLGNLLIEPPTTQHRLPKPHKPAKPPKIKLPTNSKNTSSTHTYNSSSTRTNINGHIEEKEVVNGRVIKHTINGVSQIR